MGVAQDGRDRRDYAADEVAQQRGPVNNAPRLHATHGGFIRGLDPVSGEPVVFMPGEALPRWVGEALPTGRPHPGDERVTLLGGAS